VSEVPAPVPAPEPQALDRAALLSRCTGRKAKVKPVDLPDGGRVFVRVMDGFELDAYEQGNYDIDQHTGKVQFSTKNRRARLAVFCLSDAAGNRLFNDAEASLLGRMDAPTLDAIDDAAQALNGLDRESKRAKEKNSPTPEATSASGADSPATGA